MNNHFLRKAFQVTELQACLRGFAPSRRDWDRERKPVLPRSFSLLRWPLPPLWGSWTFEGCPVRLSLSLFFSACASMPRNRPQILQLLWFLASVGEKNVALSFVLSLKTIFAKHRSYCKVSSCVLSSNFGAQGLRSWGSHFCITPCDGPFHSLIFTWSRALGEVDGVIRSKILQLPVTHEPTSITKCWRKQTSTTFFAETKVLHLLPTGYVSPILLSTLTFFPFWRLTHTTVSILSFLALKLRVLIDWSMCLLTIVFNLW